MMKGSFRIVPLTLCLLFFSFTACAPEERPKDILEKERFTKVLTELYVLEGKAEYRKANFSEDPEAFRSKGTGRIFREHDLSREKFIRTYYYYMERPKTMKRIHEEVLNELMRRKGKEEGKQEEIPKKEKDGEK